MNRILALLLFMYAVATAAAAQAIVTPSDPPGAGAPVASPNRTTSAQLAARTAPNPGRGVGSATSAPDWVDPTGEVVGRTYSMECAYQEAVATCIALTHYDNKPLGIKLWPNVSPGGQQSAGLLMNAPDLGFVYYPSSDCSGPAYVPYSPANAGIPQFGISIRDSDGKDYIYISDQTKFGTQPISIGSSFSDGQCHVFTSPFEYVAFPVVAVVRSSQFAAAGAIWIK